MFSFGICIMSMVHRQRAVLLQFPLVIYLAALLKCSCRWHWLTNQTVKPHPEYQRKCRFQNIRLPSVFGLCPAQIYLMRLTCVFFFFVVYKSRIFFFRPIKGIKLRKIALLWLTGENTALYFFKSTSS